MIHQSPKIYDKIAEGYKKATERPLREFTYEFTIKKHVKNLSQKTVLDLACGEGYSSRMMMKLGAKKVIGLDSSKELIKMAKEKNGNIDYFVLDVFKEDLSRFGKFNVITAIMFLHYASSKKQLQGLIKKIKYILEKKGVFYALIANPEVLEGFENYGVKMTPLYNKEGSAVKIEIHDMKWKKYCEFINYYWKKETYISAFEKEGFKVKWFEGSVSDKGIKKYGEKFWEAYKKKPLYSFIEARK